MTTPKWTEWFEFEERAVSIGGKRLPATFIHGRLEPERFPEEGMWGSAWVPVESGLYVHFFASALAEWSPDHVVASVVEKTENEDLQTLDWDLCPHEDGDPRHYRRCRVGPKRQNYLAVDLTPSRELTRQECHQPEDAFDMLRWASTLIVDGVGPRY